MDRRRRHDRIGRQLMLAQVARRDAMAALADALKEESKSEALAARSRDLLKAYGARADQRDGSTLREQAAFVRSLQDVAERADEAHKDAGEQAGWQMQSLAAAETRATRLEGRMRAARRNLEDLQSRRDAPSPQAMARKLQSQSDENGKF